MLVQEGFPDLIGDIQFIEQGFNLGLTCFFKSVLFRQLINFPLKLDNFLIKDSKLDLICFILRVKENGTPNQAGLYFRQFSLLGINRVQKSLHSRIGVKDFKQSQFSGRHKTIRV